MEERGPLPVPHCSWGTCQALCQRETGGVDAVGPSSPAVVPSAVPSATDATADANDAVLLAAAAVLLAAAVSAAAAVVAAPPPAAIVEASYGEMAADTEAIAAEILFGAAGVADIVPPAPAREETGAVASREQA